MKRISRLYALLALLLTGIIAGCCGDGCDRGCGGGGGGGSTPPADTAIILNTVLQQGYSDQIGSINVTIELPDGVTVTADSSGWIPRSSLYLSGQGAVFQAIPNTTAILIGKFYPATPTSKAKVSIAFSGIVNSGGQVTGMNPGEFATLIYNVAPGITFSSDTVLPLSGIDIANSLGVLPHLSDTTPPLAWITYQIMP